MSQRLLSTPPIHDIAESTADLTASVTQEGSYLEDIIERLRRSPLYPLDHLRWVDVGRRCVFVLSPHSTHRSLAGTARKDPETIGPDPCSRFRLFEWSGTLPFEKAKARAWIRSHEHPTLATDWKEGIDNLNRIVPAGGRCLRHLSNAWKKTPCPLTIRCESVTPYSRYPREQ